MEEGFAVTGRAKSCNLTASSCTRAGSGWAAGKISLMTEQLIPEKASQVESASLEVPQKVDVALGDTV